MKKKLLIALCLLAFTLTNLHAQSTATNQDVINNLLTNLQSNPDNPLKIDKQLLENVAKAIPDGGLKSKLLSYSANLGADQTLSMRQVYWDLGTAFASNNLSGLAQFSGTGKGLNILLNNPEELIGSIKSNFANYKPGVFMNDPYFISNIQQATGSAGTAQAVGLGFELAASYMNEAKHVKSYKADYKMYAEMSSNMVYAEIDRNLGKALIDALVSKQPRSNVNLMYRYDFDNGAAIRAENGILKFIDEKKNLRIDLMPVEQKNNGLVNLSALSNYASLYGSAPQLVMVTPTGDKVFFDTGKIDTKVNQGAECTTCLKRDRRFTLDLATGKVSALEALDKRFNIFNLDSYNITGDTLKRMVSYFYHDNRIILEIYNLYDNKPGGKVLDRLKLNKLILDKNDSGLDPFIDFYPFYKDGYAIALKWGESLRGGITTKSSVMVAFNSKEQINPQASLVNEFTGLIKSKNDILYYVTANGGVGAIDLNTTKMSDPALQSKMKSQAVYSGLIDKYNFRFNQHKYLFQDENLQTLTYQPELALSPDENYLTYVIGAKLYVIDVHKMDKPKVFNLTFEPADHFFAKENGQPTLYLRGLNEFSLPLTKKYAFTKLAEANMEPVKIATAPQAATKTETVSPGAPSVADELKKLKALLDDGTLTKAEFDAAKKKLLEKN